MIGASGGERDAVVWDVQGEVEEATQGLRPLAVLPGKNKVGVMEWNPRFNMLASADREVVFWLPEEFVGLKPA